MFSGQTVALVKAPPPLGHLVLKKSYFLLPNQCEERCNVLLDHTSHAERSHC